MGQRCPLATWQSRSLQQCRLLLVVIVSICKYVHMTVGGFAAAAEPIPTSWPIRGTFGNACAPELCRTHGQQSAWWNERLKPCTPGSKSMVLASRSTAVNPWVMMPSCVQHTGKAQMNQVPCMVQGEARTG